LLAAHLADAPELLVERRPDLPATLTTLVDRCLAKNPGERPPDASSLVTLLSSVAPTPVRRGFRLSATHVGLAVFALALLAGSGSWLYGRSERRHWARDDAVTEATRLNGADRALAAFLLLSKAQRYLPSDTAITRAVEDNTGLVSITSSPPGATVAIEDYLTPDSGWYTLGTTPLAGVRVPGGYFRWKVAKAGVGEYVTALFSRKTMHFSLDSALSAPDGMVRVEADRFWDYVGFVGWVGPYALPAFYMDRFEVTNRQYQAFVDQGGYTTRKYWTEPFIKDGRALTWEQAMALFRDRTDRPGPSTWEGGHYPDGQGDYPVSGVSWYEASAYAAFVGKSLPSFAQWYEAAPGPVGRYIVQESNISRTSLAPVGAFKGLGPFGTYDMAGNVREWTVNTVDVDRRFILGGRWDAQSYLYADPEALSPFDRSPGDGIRCVRNVTPPPPGVTSPIRTLKRDFAQFRPASDAVFSAYRVMYAYDRMPLNAKDEGVIDDTKDWRKEKVTFDAAYGDQRLAAYLFLPKRVRPPYQTVLFFPSARVLDIPNSRTLGDTSFFDYVVQSGRAVMYPVYQDTYERRVRHVWPGASQAIEITVERSKDVERAIDYLQTRPDVAADKLAYLGVSMGSAEGVIYATLAQDRLKAAVLLDGGYFLDSPPPGGDQADFAPRLKIPVLMLNGRYDFTFPVEQSQLPLFRMLGTPAADKRHVVLETPHDVRVDRPAMVKEVLAWLDTYLGRVE
jgi:dienelactone hydrolase